MSDIDSINATLRAIAEIDPTAIIAGGFLRDQFYNREAKDVDIFVSFGTNVDALIRRFPQAAYEDYSQWLEYQDGEVRSVMTIGTHGGLEVQVIELMQGLVPAERAVLHDFGFCQIYTTDLTLAPTATSEFWLDFRNHTATLCHCESEQQFDRSMKRWKRLSEKYPEKSLVIPQEFQQWQQAPF